MPDFFKKLITSASEYSSARFINVLGFFTATALIGYDTFLRGHLDDVNFMWYLAYCGGVYGVSKYLEKKEPTNVSAVNS